ncbi:MAG: helix-turn-helix transcriptional regulator [Lachnospiraceae bacterium]
MDFLEKLNYLMEQNNLNKSTLSKSCDIPYTTIDNWYKRGYEGLKLTTLRKLADYFGTSLDYWATENDELSPDTSEILRKVQNMSDSEIRAVLAFVDTLNKMNKEKQGND